MDRLQLQKLLSGGCVDLGLEVGQHDLELLMDYLQLLVKWNKAFNLTAVRDPVEMVVLHLLDSLSVEPYIEGEQILDVGSGAGLPGIPLAIRYPAKKFYLLDSNGKKTRFIKQAVMELGLDNVTVLNERVEGFQWESGFDTVVSRAFAELSDMVEWTSHLVKKGGLILAMKGQKSSDDALNNFQHVENERIIDISVPGLDAERHVVCLRGK